MIRTGERMRLMTREEILAQGAPESDTRQAESRLAKAKAKILASQLRTFWLRFEPSADLSLDLQGPRIEKVCSIPSSAATVRPGTLSGLSTARPQLSGNRLGAAAERVGRRSRDKAAWYSRRP